MAKLLYVVEVSQIRTQIMTDSCIIRSTFSSSLLKSNLRDLRFIKCCCSHGLRSYQGANILCLIYTKASSPLYPQPMIPQLSPEPHSEFHFDGILWDSDLVGHPICISEGSPRHSDHITGRNGNHNSTNPIHTLSGYKACNLQAIHSTLPLFTQGHRYYSHCYSLFYTTITGIEQIQISGTRLSLSPPPSLFRDLSSGRLAVSGLHFFSSATAAFFISLYYLIATLVPSTTSFVSQLFSGLQNRILSAYCMR